ncbi:MAG: 4Fe-4S dicluster domain-containing protein [Candidatus Hodarchaeales archaeon]|jgi:molybdopterin-containing oxidoreductase family iron-sulfur binding subunit
MRTSRRDFLKYALGGAGALLAGATIIKTLPGGEKKPISSTAGESNETGEKISHKVPDDPKRHWGFVIDLSRCNGCGHVTDEDVESRDPPDPTGERFWCSYACRVHHFYNGADPPQYWIRVYKLQENSRSPTFWFPKPCMNCQNPPCLHVCPTGATFARKDGTVIIDTDICIGCRLCMAACPYETRFFWFNDPPDVPGTENIEYTPEFQGPHTRGTVVKCDYCVHLAYNGQLPVCVTACSISAGRQALYYGDLNEDAVSNGIETLELRKTLAEKGGYRYQEEDGTDPSVWYLPPAGQSKINTLLQTRLNIEIRENSGSSQRIEVDIHAKADDGTPIRHAEVFLRRKTAFGALIVAKGTTDSNGTYSCSFQRTNSHEITIEAELVETKRYSRTVVNKNVK